jgi:hypothetical protein
MFRYGCLLAVIVLVGLPVLASRFLPWWGTCLAIVGEGVLLVVVGPKLVALAIKRFAVGLFKTKSEVLKGAAVHVHSVDSSTKPVEPDESAPDTEDPGEPPDDSRYVLIDFTLTPLSGTSKMNHWEPGELMLVPFDLPNDAKEVDHLSASIVELKMIDEVGNETEDFDKIVGPGRFKATFACPRQLTGRVKFRYYFEGFGDVMLP